MSLEKRTTERIAQEFAGSDLALVGELLDGYSGSEAGRVVWDILELSQGSVEEVRRYLQAAQVDYRDVLYWAEYYKTDPSCAGGIPGKGWAIFWRSGEAKRETRTLHQSGPRQRGRRRVSVP